MSQTHLCTPPPPTITTCCPQAWSGTKRIHGCSSGKRYQNKEFVLSLLQTRLAENTKWAAPVLGVTVAGTADWAHPPAFHNTFHVLRPDLPVYLKAKQRGTSVLELPFESGCLSPIPGREGAMEGAQERGEQGRPLLCLHSGWLRTQLPLWSPPAVLPSFFIPRAASALAEKLPVVMGAVAALGLLCQEEVLAGAWDNEGRLWRCPGPGAPRSGHQLPKNGSTVGREGLLASPGRSTAASGCTSVHTQR